MPISSSAQAVFSDAWEQLTRGVAPTALSNGLRCPHRFGLGLLAAHLLHVFEAWSPYRTPRVQHFRVSFSHRLESLKKGVAKMIEISWRELKSAVRFRGSGQSRRLCPLTEVEESFDRLIDHDVPWVHQTFAKTPSIAGDRAKEFDR